jgi:hypothetical protein
LVGLQREHQGLANNNRECQGENAGECSNRD